MTEPNATETKPKATRHRSPAYPAISLADAVQKAEAFYKDHHLHLVPVEAATKSWNLDRSSGPGGRAVSALKQFGLIEEDEANGDRRVRLSELARRIVQLPNHDLRRKEAISEAARKPTIHRDLLEYYPTGLPPEDPALRSYLEYERKFNRNAIEALIKEIRDTWAFAQLDESGTMSDIMGEDPSPQEGHSMMTTGTARQGGNPAPPHIPEAHVKFVELQIPEVGGHTSVLRTVMPKTEEELDYLREVLNSNLEAWRKRLHGLSLGSAQRDKDS